MLHYTVFLVYLSEEANQFHTHEMTQSLSVQVTFQYILDTFYVTEKWNCNGCQK